FIEYSLTTGMGATAGLVIGMLLSQAILSKYYQSEVPHLTMRILQLSACTLPADGLWQLAYHLANHVFKNAGALAYGLEALVFVGLQWMTHKIITQSGSYQNHSYKSSALFALALFAGYAMFDYGPNGAEIFGQRLPGWNRLLGISNNSPATIATSGLS